jgi:predicted NBD/HSP70 family sugar kinase
VNNQPSWRGTNVVRVAGFNLAVLIDTVRRSPAGLSRVELAAATGLSEQAVSNIARRALELGLLVEGERQQPQGMGRPRTPLLLNPAGSYAVGVHIDPQGTTYVVVDLAGRVVARAGADLDLAAAPADALAEIAARIEDLTASSGTPRSRIAGIGFASPGTIDLARGKIVAPPHLPTWRDVDVTADLRRLTSLGVVLDKDVAAAAVGERWAGRTMGATHSAYLYLSTGVGTGIVAGGSVLRGSTGNAGDVGHLCVDPDGPPCPCGLRGCLAGVLSNVGILTDAMQSGALPTAPITPGASGPLLSALVGCYDAGIPSAVEVVERAAQRLAVAIRTIANFSDADVVAIGGPTWEQLAPVIEPLLPRHLEPGLARGTLAPFQVVGSSLGKDAAAIGAACLVLDNAFTPNADTIAL